MLDNAILDVAIGLVLVYLTLGLVCTAISELINQRLGLRSSTLQDALLRLLEGESTRAAFFAHPLISPLREANDTYPSYVPSELFARAVLDLAAKGKPPANVEELRAILVDPACGLPTQPRQALLTLLDASVTDLDEARRRIAAWFDHTMDRASGWYRRHIQRYTFLASLVLVTVLNADTLAIARATWNDEGLRHEVAAQAQLMVSAGQDGPGQVKKAAEVLQEELRGLQKSGVPLGWDHAAVAELIPALRDDDAPDDTHMRVATVLAWLQKVFGLFASAFAVSLGAPFWFDLLNRLTRLRTTVVDRTPTADTAAR